MPFGVQITESVLTEFKRKCFVNHLPIGVTVEHLLGEFNAKPVKEEVKSSESETVTAIQ